MIRRNGNTTRIVDDLVQQLFTRGIVYLRDHEYDSYQMNEYCARIFMDRLHNEHKDVKVYYEITDKMNIYARLHEELSVVDKNYLHLNKLNVEGDWITDYKRQRIKQIKK